jgi:hypothetical protein
MKQKTKKISVLAITIIMVLCFQMMTFALSTWSDAGTYDLDHDTDWKRLTTTGIYLNNEKDSDSINVSVYTVSKTMASNPSFRIVNSDNVARCTAFTTASAGKSKTDDSNTGEEGYTYFASVKSAWNQVTDGQSIRIKFKTY